MNIYKLPNGSFIKLDALISVGPHYLGDYSTSCLCDLRFALMEHALIARLSTFDWNGDDPSSKVERKRQGMIKRGEKERLKLIAAWKAIEK